MIVIHLILNDAVAGPAFIIPQKGFFTKVLGI